MPDKIDKGVLLAHYKDAHEALTTLGVPHPENWSVLARIEWMSEHIPGLWELVVAARERWEREQKDLSE